MQRQAIDPLQQASCSSHCRQHAASQRPHSAAFRWRHLAASRRLVCGASRGMQCNAAAAETSAVHKPAAAGASAVQLEFSKYQGLGNDFILVRCQRCAEGCCLMVVIRVRVVGGRGGRCVCMPCMCTCGTARHTPTLSPTRFSRPHRRWTTATSRSRSSPPRRPPGCATATLASAATECVVVSWAPLFWGRGGACWGCAWARSLACMWGAPPWGGSDGQAAAAVAGVGVLQQNRGGRRSGCVRLRHAARERSPQAGEQYEHGRTPESFQPKCGARRRSSLRCRPPAAPAQTTRCASTTATAASPRCAATASAAWPGVRNTCAVHAVRA